MKASLQLRRRQDALTRLASTDLAVLWRQVSNAVELRIALQDVLPALTLTYGQAAAAMAAEWYDELRSAVGIGGSFVALPAVLDGQATDALALWATSSGADLVSIQTLVEGGLSRRINDWSRLTITESSVADPSARGWQRVGLGGCDFCAMLIGRGEVYTETTASFDSHDHCHCGAEPAFEGVPLPVQPRDFPQRGTDAEVALAEEWIAEH